MTKDEAADVLIFAFDGPEDEQAVRASKKADLLAGDQEIIRGMVLTAQAADTTDLELVNRAAQTLLT